MKLAVGIALLVVAFVALRLAFHDADPPNTLSGSVERAQDFWLEPPAKAHEARNWALFGRWQTNPADRYQFWRRQSPVWVYPLAATFSLFGVSYATLRAFSTAIALAGFLLALLLARDRCSAHARLLMGVCLSASFYAILLDRAGLIEVLVTTLIATTVVCLYRGDRHPAWLTASQLAFTAAFFAKQGAIYAFPLLVVANIVSFRKHLRRGPPTWLTWLPVASALILATFATLYINQPEYQRALSWNYQHMMLARGDAATPLVDHLNTLFRRAFSASRYRWHWLIPFPIVGTIAFYAALKATVQIARRRHIDRWDALVAAWFTSAFLALLLIRQNEVRFTSILILPMFLLFAQTLTDLLEWTSSRNQGRLGIALAVTTASTCVTWDAVRYAGWISSRSYQLTDGAARIVEAIGERPAVVAGRFSAPLILETPYVHYYIKWYFNTAPETIRALQVTHAIWRTYDEETLIHFSKLGNAHEKRRHLLDLPFRGDAVQLVEFDKPLE